MAYQPYQQHPGGDQKEFNIPGVGPGEQFLPPPPPPAPPVNRSAYRAATLGLYPAAPSGNSPEPIFPSLPLSYSDPTSPRLYHSVPAFRPKPLSVSAPAHPRQPYTSSQAPISSYSTPQAYLPYAPAENPQDYSYTNSTSTYNTPQAFPPYPSVSSSQQPLPYPQSYQPISYDPKASTLGQNTFSYYDLSHQPTVSQRLNSQYAQTTYPAEPLANTAQQTTLVLEPVPRDSLTRVSVQDGEGPESFSSAKALGDYLKIFPEAENDQGCRVFKYGPKCSTQLLMPLFERFDFPRYSVFPYGFAGDFSIADHWGAGSCNCQKCTEGQLCGQYVLHKNLRSYMYLEVKPSSSTSPKISSSQDAMTISTGERADWNLQLLRFRSRRNQTTIFAYDALVYQNYESGTKLKSNPLDYVFTQLDDISTNWDSVLNASSQFLSSFRVEVLEERLEADRSIIRNLLVAAQHWEEFRKTLQAQLERIKFLENVYSDPRWTEGRDNYYHVLEVSSGYVKKFRGIDYRITTELMQETDSLIQRVTNLITIDEGYRSRDQNESIRRLTWITFIFLPLIFTAGIFSMQVNLFDVHAAWQYYIYTSLVLTFVVFSGYALLRSRRRLKRFLGSLTFWLLTKPAKYLSDWGKMRKKAKLSRVSGVDLEEQSSPSVAETPIVLKWAASSGRTDVVRNILETANKKTKLMLGTSGHALLLAIQNGHTEAANLLIDRGEGMTYTDDNSATLLHWAARMGQSSICQRLLGKGVSLGAKDNEGQTALDWAMKGNHELTINMLLRGGKNITRQETANLQSLHLSARTGDIGKIKDFHNQGSSLEARDGKGQTVLFHAVKGNQHHIVRWLTVEGQANVQAVDKEGLTALHVAAQRCDLQSAEILLERNASVNAMSSRNLTPLHCIPHSEGVSVLRLLHEKGADVNAVDKDNNRITHKAARKGDSASLLFKVASDLGADVEASGAQGNTPAHLAAESGSKAILGILIQKKVELEKTRNLAGYTPLMIASQAGKVEVMRLLLDKGVSYNVVDSHGRSLTELTIAWGNPDVVALLQEYGADYSDVTTASGQAHPVWQAVYDGHGASIAKILDGGLSVEYEHRGVRLLQLAIECNNVEVVRLLIERKAAVNVPDMRGWTALHSAAYSGNHEVMLLILQNTETRETIDQQGWTPLDLATFYKHDQITKLLDPEGKVKEFAWMKTGRIRINASSYLLPHVESSAIPGVAEAP